MCAEYTPGQTMEVEKLLIAIETFKNILRENYEDLRIFPRSQAPIIRKHPNGTVEMLDAEFSLIPSWWNPEKAEKKTKTGRPVFATHNARLESIDEKPTFKDAFKNRHCLVPISSFFESSLFGNKFAGNRLRINSDGLMLAAGCYTEWVDKSTGQVVTSFTIITHIPNEEIFDAGHDRMPVFLDRKQAFEWLHSEGKNLAELKEFLLTHSVNHDLKLNIEIDRALKPGWEKNAPENEDLIETEKLVRKKPAG
ncbi:MAG: SOS response-associated peptidase [Pseudobdellovibrionaceae bacterium]